MKNSHLQSDSNRGTSAYEAKSLIVVLLDEISIEHFKMFTVLYMSVLLKFTYTAYHVVDVVKCFVLYYILLTLHSQKTS